MARQLVYEGTDLQQLLQQVIDEHGPARIHPPERRRKGGVLGFFAREVFVITVDVDAPTGSQAAADRPAAPAGDAAVAESGRAAAIARAEHAPDHGAVVAHAGSAPLSDLAARSPLAALVESTEDEAELGGAHASVPPSGGGQGAANGYADRAPNGSEAAGVERGPLHAAPTEVDKPFGEVLSEVASSLGEEPGTYRPDPERLRRPRRAEADADGPADAPLVAGEATGGEGTAGGGAAGGDAATGGDAAAAGDVEDHLPVGREAAEPDVVTSSIAVQLPLIGIEGEEAPDLGATIVDLLRAAGFPEHLLPRAPLATDQSTIEAVFASLPEPPPLPSEPGGLVAVVGSAGLVRPIANAVALAVGCPRDEVAVASTTASDRHARPEYRARTAAQAASLSPGWRRDRVGIVAVYAPPLGADQRWTRQVLRALRPSCVWGMTAATTKPDDVRRWIAAIGGVDALVMTEVGATATPAAILSLGIPVARLDDEPATPARWAAAVADLVTKH